MPCCEPCMCLTGRTGSAPPDFPRPANFMDVSREELRNSYRQTMAAVFDAVSPRPDWILQFASGDTGRVLVRQSEDARLLVVGTREHVGLARILDGSVSHYCLTHAVMSGCRGAGARC